MNCFDETLIKISALVVTALICIAVPNSNSVYAQSGAGGNATTSAGSLGARSALRGSNLGRRDFGAERGPRGFAGPFRDARSRLFGAPGVAGPLAPLGYPGVAGPLGASNYDSLGCVLHRPVDTPRGRIYEPVYVC
jgi:hypothetical protein